MVSGGASTNGSKLRILICGAGNRAFPKNPRTSLFRGWFETIRRSPEFELVGIQDVSQGSLDRINATYPLGSIRTFLTLKEALEQTSPDAVLICPIAEAHAAAALMAIEAGCHLLIEKPMVTSITDAFRIESAARKRGAVVSVVQNWRAKSVGLALREAVQSGRTGRVGTIFFRYVRDREQPHLPAYLFEEPYPLLYAMSIHHFDLFRFALDENIVTIEGKPFSPPWSRYKSFSGVQLWMTTEKGVNISYVGTFSSKNRHVPQESFVLDGERGSASNDSQWGDPPLLFSGVDGSETLDLTAGASRDVADQYNQADDVYLEDFHRAISTSSRPLCPAADNIWTLAAINAAVEACDTGRPVNVRELVETCGRNAADAPALSSTLV
jgi:predicted dehydrogenase